MSRQNATAEQVLAAQRDPQALAEFCEANQAMVWDAVWRFVGRVDREGYCHPAGFEWDDLCQIAWCGFLQAVKGYDAAFGTAFSTYAYPHMWGAMVRTVSRQYAGGVHLTRAQHHAKAGPSVLSLQAPQYDDGESDALTLGDMLACEADVADCCANRADAEAALAGLGEQARAVVGAIAFRGLIQADVARAVGVSQATVSRTLTAASRQIAAAMGVDAPRPTRRQRNGSRVGARAGAS